MAELDSLGHFATLFEQGFYVRVISFSKIVPEHRDKERFEDLVSEYVFLIAAWVSELHQIFHPSLYKFGLHQWPNKGAGDNRRCAFLFSFHKSLVAGHRRSRVPQLGLLGVTAFRCSLPHSEHFCQCATV